MKKTVGIGIQDFEEIRTKDCFYVDKTAFIREWWEQDDKVTLITRPRRFGKTPNMSMLECFFSNKYAGRGGQLFEGLKIWEEEKYRKLQGTYPVPCGNKMQGLRDYEIRAERDTRQFISSI